MVGVDSSAVKNTSRSHYAGGRCLSLVHLLLVVFSDCDKLSQCIARSVAIVTGNVVAGQ